MLRAVVAIVGASFLTGGIVLFLALRQVWPVGAELAVLGALILAGLFFERHYRGSGDRANRRLQRTGERFVDPTSGKLTDVLYDPATGERVYRDAADVTK